MKVIEVHCKRWFLRKWIRGIVLYPFIFYQGKPSKKLRRHEWIHIEQVRRDGFIRFYGRYLHHSLIKRTPYRDIPYEAEAYRRQRDTRFCPWADEYKAEVDEGNG